MILFTAIAGMSSVAYMDVVIGLLATVSMIASLPVLIHLAGGIAGVHAALPATHFQVLGDLTLAQGFELFLPTCLLMLGNQSMYQKFFSAKSEKDASRAVIGWFIGAIVLETVIVAIAVTGSALFPAGEVHDHPREILAYSGMNALPTWLGVFLVGAIFAKIISTANNYLFSPATNLVNDVFVRYMQPDASNKRILIVSRLMVVLLGIWALYQSLHTESVLKESLYAYTIYSAALTPVILAAFFWKRTTATAAVVSIARRDPGDGDVGLHLRPHPSARHPHRPRRHLSRAPDPTYRPRLRQSHNSAAIGSPACTVSAHFGGKLKIHVTNKAI